MKKFTLLNFLALTLLIQVVFVNAAYAKSTLGWVSYTCNDRAVVSGMDCNDGFDAMGPKNSCMAGVATCPSGQIFSCESAVCYTPSTGTAAAAACPTATISGVTYSALTLALDSNKLGRLVQCGDNLVKSYFGPLAFGSDGSISNVTVKDINTGYTAAQCIADGGVPSDKVGLSYTKCRGPVILKSGGGMKINDQNGNTILSVNGEGYINNPLSGAGGEIKIKDNDGLLLRGENVIASSSLSLSTNGISVTGIDSGMPSPVYVNDDLGVANALFGSSASLPLQIADNDGITYSKENAGGSKAGGTVLLGIYNPSKIFGLSLTGDYSSIVNPNNNCTNIIIDWVNSTTGWGLSNPPGACPLLINAGAPADINGSFPTTLSGGILTNALTTMGIMIYGPGETINSPQGGLMINTFGGGETINAIGTGGFNMASTLGGLENNGAKLGRSVEKYPVRITDGDGLSVNGPIQNTWPFPKKAAFSPDYATGTAYGFTNAQWESACTSTGGTINAYDVNNDNKTCEYPVYVKKNLNVGANTVLWSDGTVKAGDVFSTHLYGNSITSYGGINTMNSGDVHAMGSLIADGNLSVAGTTNLKVILTAPFCGFGPCICLNGGGQVLDWSSAKKCAIVGP